MAIQLQPQSADLERWLTLAQQESAGFEVMDPFSLSGIGQFRFSAEGSSVIDAFFCQRLFTLCFWVTFWLFSKYFIFFIIITFVMMMCDQ